MTVMMTIMITMMMTMKLILKNISQSDEEHKLDHYERLETVNFSPLMSVELSHQNLLESIIMILLSCTTAIFLGTE